MQRSDVSYCLHAPFRIEVQVQVAASPRTTFEILTDPEAMKHGFADFVASRWMTAPPHGLGSSREVQCKAIAMRERILAWEPARRITTAVQAMTAPLVRAMVQDQQLTATESGWTRVRWGIYNAPSRSLRLLHPLVRTMFDDMLSKSAQALEHYAGGDVTRAAHA